MGKWFKKQSANPIDDWLEGYELPDFSAAITDMMRIIRDDETTNTEVAEGLAVDPGTSVRILRLVNSPGYGLRQPVESLVHAVQLIGRSSLESILIAAAVKGTLPAQSQQGFDSKRFWRTSARRAALSSAFAQSVCPADRSLCWTAGLLQDLAVPLLVSQRPDVYCEVLRAWHQREGNLVDLEREMLGFDHSEVSSRICRRWELPERLCNAIADHHDIDKAPAPVALAALLYEGDDPDVCSEVIPAAETLCGIESEECERLIEVAFERADELAALLS